MIWIRLTTVGKLLTVGKARPGRGIVYLIRMELDDGLVVWKIGITTRKIEDRLQEIVISFFKKYRYIPRTSVKKFSSCDNYFEVETRLHKEYKDSSYKFDKVFSGSCEFFSDLDEDRLVERYIEVMKELG